MPKIDHQPVPAQDSSPCPHNRGIEHPETESSEASSLTHFRLTAQTRHFDRERLRIPVRVQIGNHTVFGYTYDFGPGGLRLILEIPLKAGTPLLVRCSFGNVCYLNLSAQSVYSSRTDRPRRFGIGIKFSAFREWEQTILLSAVKELKHSASTRKKSLLTLMVSRDILAAEAAQFLIPSGDRSAISEDSWEFSDDAAVEELAASTFSTMTTDSSQATVPLRDPLLEEEGQNLGLLLPTYTLLVNGEELDTHRYEYFVYADKWITEQKTVLQLRRQLKSGQIPSNYAEYIFARYCVGDKVTNKAAMEAAYAASKEFRYFPISKRMKIGTDIYDLLLAHKEHLIELMVIEGHPRRLAEWEFWGMEQAYRKPSLDFYKQHLTTRIGVSGREVLYWKRKPDGVVCVSPPRSAPCSSSLIAGFALLAGNAVIVKPPLRCPLSTLYLWKNVVHEALKVNQAPSGTLNLVLGNSEVLIHEWITSPHVNDLIFIGGSSKGLQIGTRAFQHGKKAILELSGNDMAFVWRDAPLDEAVESLMDGFLGSTQICMVPKKAFVHEEIYGAFEAAFLTAVKALKVGLPSNPDVSLMPVLKLSEFYEFLEDALAKGGELLCGGSRVNHLGKSDKRGAFITPAVIRVKNLTEASMMRCVREENFFPLIPLVKVTAKDSRNQRAKQDLSIFRQMVQVANTNEYGLRISVWVTSPSYTHRFVEQIHNSGLLRINCRHVGFSPFLATHGGTGKSGGPYGEMNYVWQKTTHLQGVSLVTMSKSLA